MSAESPLGAVQHLLIYKVCVPVRSICVLSTHTRWVVRVPIRVGSVEPRKEPGVQLPSPDLLFTNLVTLVQFLNLPEPVISILPVKIR